MILFQNCLLFTCFLMTFSSPLLLLAQEPEDKILSTNNIDKANELMKKAKVAYDKGNYEEAVAKYEEAYRLVKDDPESSKEALSSLLFNIVGGYAFLENHEMVIEYSEKFLQESQDSSDPDTLASRLEVERLRKKSEEKLAQQKALLEVPVENNTKPEETFLDTPPPGPPTKSSSVLKRFALPVSLTVVGAGLGVTSLLMKSQRTKAGEATKGQIATNHIIAIGADLAFIAAGFSGYLAFRAKPTEKQTSVTVLPIQKGALLSLEHRF